MQSTVVVAVDVLGHRDLEVVDFAPGAAVADELGFEERVGCFGLGVVVAVALRAGRRDAARRSV